MQFKSPFKTPKTISQKMLAAIFIASSLVTFFITIIQLSFDYFQEVNSVKKSMVLIEKSYTHSIANSLWQLRFSELQSQVEGILTIPGIKNVQVFEQNKVIAKAGNFHDSETLVTSVDLTHLDNENKTLIIGKLVVTANMDEVLDKILRKVMLLFVTQLLKTLLVSFLIYLCLQQIITKHLVHISSYLKEMNLNKIDKPISLKRKNNEVPDELDTLTDSINEMSAKINHSYQILNELNKELEKKVEIKTQLILEQRIKLEYTSKMSTLGEMAGGIAHEINNPMTVISATNRVLRKSVDKGITDPLFYAKYFDEIDKTVTRVTKIITGLRVVSRDGSNENFRNEKIFDILTDVVSLCGEKFKNNGVDLKINLEDEVYQSQIQCGRIQLSQVFLNLLGNAYDAIESLPEKWIMVECKALEGKLELRISDSGAGIPKEIQEKILQPFFTTKEVGKGTGLGLSISNSIVKNHNGEFVIDNECKNTCFVLTFPLVDSDALMKLTG